MSGWLIFLVVVAVLCIGGYLLEYAERRGKATIVRRTRSFLDRNPSPRKIAKRYFDVRKDYGEAGKEAMSLILNSDAPNAVEAQRIILEQLEGEEARQSWLDTQYGILRFPLVGWGIGSHRVPLLCCRCGRKFAENRYSERKISQTFSLPGSASPTTLSIRFPVCLNQSCKSDPHSGFIRPEPDMYWTQVGGTDTIEISMVHLQFVRAFNQMNH
ncbi:hypothetical protein MYX77_08945 [Acidobacteriia bacterium AH_259_A11_L15]|nr:hypothetical protein [Acidobacteriia bacterium AH_259_A11_L15]